MFRYSIEGRHPIKGRIRASGNKNAALPCLAATVLSHEPVTLENVPDIEDVRVMLKILESLGATTRAAGPHAWVIDPSGITSDTIPYDLAIKVRASILFAGPLVARCGQAVLPPPGGDVIGRRRIDTHVLALEALGAHFTFDTTMRFSAKELLGAHIFLDEASVTATENAVMCAVRAKGSTVIRNAASEPHVQDLCKMLCAMGAQISGIGSNVLVIEGVTQLHGTRFAIGSDYMEVGSFIGLAAATSGEVEIEGVNPDDLHPLKIGFAHLGIEWETKGTSIFVRNDKPLRIVPDIGNQIPKIDDAPWPGFPPDITSIMTVVATQAEGTILIHEKMFESRMFWVDKLLGMGARIVLCDPHRAVVSGPTKLRADTLTSPDVRAGMAMVIAALCSEGTSTIHNVYQIERGYEKLCERLSAIGAHIERCE